MCLWKSSESCCVDGGVAQLIRQSAEGHRASDSECPTAKCAEPMSRNHQPVTSGWMQVLSCSNLGYWCTVVRQVHWSLPEETSRQVCNWLAQECQASVNPGASIVTVLGRISRYRRWALQLHLARARATTLFQKVFSMTFPWPKNANPWPIGTTYFSK